MYYDLAADTWGPEEKAAIQNVVNSGRLTMGPKVAEFEAAFAKYFGRRHAVMVNSGSSGNLVGIASLFYRSENPLKRGDEVIVPAIAWSTTYSPLQQYGLKLRFVDVELDTLNMDVRRLDEALNAKTRMIVGVSILGNPAALDKMRKFAEQHGLIFFEDNCESMDAELGGQKTGSFGDISTFSTFFSHHISTIEGGVITTDDDELNALARSIRTHGWTRDLPDTLKLSERRDDDFYEAYRFILPGYNVRPQEINAAVGLEQLKKLPYMTDVRRRNWLTFSNLFKGDDRFIIQRENGKSSCFSFTLILNPEKLINRNKVLDALTEGGIGYRLITGGCFPRHDVIQYFDFELVGEMTNGNVTHDNGFFVGNHPFDLTSQIERFHAIMDIAGN
ncbi:MAG TPA: DegT/DnrJ/EryC1/StrS family aminotransferase [Rhodospirillales bacterium]|nr:DegT/DnrJ/EryC1/StrS family aminotransferase [Rhodospirillales bacterium]